MFAPSDFISIAFAAPLLIAGAWDLVYYRIPNAISLLLAALFLICALVWGTEVDWLSHTGTALVTLTVGLVLFAFNLFGGGDVKLLTAVALWIGWGAEFLSYLLVVSLVGGAMALALLLVRYVISIWSWPARLRQPRILLPGSPVPYGVAISAAALWLAPHASQFIFLR